jgi:eukaryotic-like serine/threonine-protein kinase
MELRDLRGDWPLLSALLDEALALPASERSAWLTALTGERAALRETLARLLAAAPGIATDDLLAAPPRFGAPASDADADRLGVAAAGDSVGPYRLLSELGRGGMGAVWLAERADAQPRRRIALKLPHLGWAPGLAARLARERDILASLEHPNIARLYDAGVDELGRPYLALEYVDGVPIDRYCQSRALPLRARLDLIMQIAAAVGHAHTRLVVHRDLKPTNILVTEKGEVRLLDFGIAKLVQDDEGGEASELTRIAGRALTPDYASPEQIRGEPIGTASDVYSLGVVSYELLAGARPYRLKTVAGAGNLGEAIAQVDVPLASTAAAEPALARQLAGDLDAILNKALKKERFERYPTVDSFAADIGRHVRGEPVAARPDSSWYRLERWLRRHKLETAIAAAIVIAVPAGAAAQAAVLTAIAAGAGVALWQARRARLQARLAEAEAARAEQVKDFALSILLGANTDTGAGAATTAVDVLMKAQERIENELTGRPETSVELMTAVGDGLFGFGRLADADAILRKAIELARRELGPRHARTLAASVVHGAVLVSLDRSTEARNVLEPAVAEARRQNATHVLIDALRWLSSAQFGEGDVDGGVASAQAAVAVLSEPSASASKLDTANAWASLSNALNVAQREGQADAARRALAAARDLYGDRLTESVLGARLLLAKGLAAEGADAEALEALGLVFADAERFFGPQHPQMLTIANFLGQVRLDCGDAPGAVAAFRTQLAAAERKTGGDGALLGLTHSALARALAAARRREEALPHFEASARFLQEAGGANALFAARSLSGRAFTLACLGRLDEAESAFAQLAGVAWNDAEHAAHAGRLAILRGLQGRHDEAIALARTSVEGARTHPSKIVRATASAALGTVLFGAGRREEAVAPLRDAVALYAKKELVMSADHTDAQTLLGLAEAPASR